jgi:hypothetical protein
VAALLLEIVCFTGHRRRAVRLTMRDLGALGLAVLLASGTRQRAGAEL